MNINQTLGSVVVGNIRVYSLGVQCIEVLLDGILGNCKESQHTAVIISARETSSSIFLLNRAQGWGALFRRRLAGWIHNALVEFFFAG